MLSKGQLFAIKGMCCVLILVLMEYALEDAENKVQYALGYSLNPCFNGICSRSAIKSATTQEQKGLNPCFNGICSRR